MFQCNEHVFMQNQDCYMYMYVTGNGLIFGEKFSFVEPICVASLSDLPVFASNTLIQFTSDSTQ